MNKYIIDYGNTDFNTSIVITIDNVQYIVIVTRNCCFFTKEPVKMDLMQFAPIKSYN